MGWFQWSGLDNLGILRNRNTNRRLEWVGLLVRYTRGSIGAALVPEGAASLSALTALRPVDRAAVVLPIRSNAAGGTIGAVETGGALTGGNGGGEETECRQREEREQSEAHHPGERRGWTGNRRILRDGKQEHSVSE